MSDFEDDSDGAPAVKRFDLKVEINLPADAPDNHPHLLDPNSVGDDLPPENLTTADAIATVLYKISPKMLSELLDLKIKRFKFVYGEIHRAEFYIDRFGPIVKVNTTLDQQRILI
jgi:hypothetical protein